MVDPLGEAFESYTSYIYGNNSPIRYSDPTGMAATDSTLFGGIIKTVTVWGNKKASGTFLNIGMWSVVNAFGFDYAFEKGINPETNFDVLFAITTSTTKIVALSQGNKPSAEPRPRNIKIPLLNNSIPKRLARVIPANIKGNTLGAPGLKDVFVTAAEDIKGLNASQIAEKLTIPKSVSDFLVIEFDTPSSGLSSPINRDNPGFIGFGLTEGGAREFTIPNQQNVKTQLTLMMKIY
ncbi:hypothetical protein SMI01S_15950 [Sphingobacterium mizutaii NBRC 14946 = DSM 11724]|nr:hypothetical protein SMI01S_15950 [Sphingobacterium mizutaii NBRC 14946 = DSM 11724]